MDTVILEYFRSLSEPFFDPQKRVFIGYLGCAFIIALGVQLCLLGLSLREAIYAIFCRKVWFSASALADYKLLLINHFLMMGMGPRLISKLALATLVFETLHYWFNGRTIIFPDMPGWAIASAFAVALFILDDASKYLVHRALHRWPVLWAFHRVHHSAETLTPLTVYRTHPAEAFIFSLRGIVVHAGVIGSFIFCFGERVELLTVLGVNVLLFVFNVTGANLRHSHVWITYGRFVEHFLISPAQHQIHHSVHARDHDRNFGVILAIWDWMGGSLSLAGHRQRLRFGVADRTAKDHSLKNLYLVPLTVATRAVATPLLRDIPKMTHSLFLFLRCLRSTGGLAFMVGLLTHSSAAISSELNIYSHRQPFLIKPFVEAYESQTGTKINIVYASKGLAQRLQAEGNRSPADVILTVDIARLHVYADKDLLAPILSPVLTANIPEHLRDPENRWFAFSKRARILAVSKRLENINDIQNYEDLANPKWGGRVCSRPGSHVYNRALVASVIYALGSSAAEAWAKGVFGNLARRPQGNDRAQVKAIFEGQCDIAVINNYYFGKLKYSNKPEQRAWAGAVNLIFPNQNGRGTHINISGGGVAKYSANKVEAQSFLEFLTSRKAQDLYASVNFEYPVNTQVPLPNQLASSGNFKEDRMPIARIAELAPEAQRIIDRVRW
ncbi:MAG: hypothetical protein CBB68_13415 [Rhodospirillaceae bacterium TMED8]|nr:hypothetical protein [Magnetovibrio sp.]OUT48560.1 MAG: hypothetical protein CBB68_13415 [Rhodospirillaceae bacterium TMED8]|tara:strand:- start:91 stop:2100 length:2010 start_codon:yes stop_codon:yes gene_type:complete